MLRNGLSWLMRWPATTTLPTSPGIAVPGQCPGPRSSVVSVTPSYIDLVDADLRDLDRAERDDRLVGPRVGRDRLGDGDAGGRDRRRSSAPRWSADRRRRRRGGERDRRRRRRGRRAGDGGRGGLGRQRRRAVVAATAQRRRSPSVAVDAARGQRDRGPRCAASARRTLTPLILARRRGGCSTRPAAAGPSGRTPGCRCRGSWRRRGRARRRARPRPRRCAPRGAGGTAGTHRPSG